MFLALKFRKWLGGEDAINGYTHKLAYEGGKHLASIFGTEVMDPSGEATLCMVRTPPPSFALTHSGCLSDQRAVAAARRGHRPRRAADLYEGRPSTDRALPPAAVLRDVEHASGRVCSQRRGLDAHFGSGLDGGASGCSLCWPDIANRVGYSLRTLSMSGRR